MLLGKHAFTDVLLFGDLINRAPRRVRDSLGREDKKRGFRGLRRMCKK
jgi:hypothetical protein